LLLDTSGSMAGRPIRALNDGFKLFCHEIGDDPLARKRTEVAIVTFGGTPTIAHAFGEARELTPLTFHAGGSTPMAAAIELGLDLVDERKRQYREGGFDYYRPWLFLITDGEPTDGDDAWRGATVRARHAEDARAVAIFTVGVEGADMAKLGEVSSRSPRKLDGLRFAELFAWLSNSLAVVSQSSAFGSSDEALRKGEMLALPPADDWAAV
jgi:uncharacterized protein YegL